jgi:hypothetical protein
MSNQQKLTALKRWSDIMKRSDDLLAPVIDVLDLRPEGPVTTALWITQDALTKATAELVGDHAEWLNWFAADNELGAKGMEAGPDGQLRSIKTLEDLLWVIEVTA